MKGKITFNLFKEYGCRSNDSIIDHQQNTRGSQSFARSKCFYERPISDGKHPMGEVYRIFKRDRKLLMDNLSTHNADLNVSLIAKVQFADYMCCERSKSKVKKVNIKIELPFEVIVLL